jgi:WD40 repeat protein
MQFRLMRRLNSALALVLALSPVLGFGQTGKAEPANPHDVIFRRSTTGDVYALDSVGHLQKLLEKTGIAALSPDGQYLAYWRTDQHEVHVFCFRDKSDRAVENMPGGVIRDMVWTADSSSVAYLGKLTPPGLHLIDLHNGMQRVLPGSYPIIGAAADGAHLLAIQDTKLEKLAIADGRAHLLRDFGSVIWNASELANGSLLGVLITHEDPPEATDDEPNCQGPTIELMVLRQGTPTAIPYPAGFDSVLDFEFAPDGQAVAVTYGAAGCDYPGEVARVYVVRLSDLKMEAASAADRLSVKVKWSPDGRSLAFSDYTAGNDSSLYQYDLDSHKLTRLTNPGDDGPDEILGWRRH